MAVGKGEADLPTLQAALRAESAASAQLVAASRAKADPSSRALQGLLNASQSLNQATSRLAEAATSALRPAAAAAQAAPAGDHATLTQTQAEEIEQRVRFPFLSLSFFISFFLFLRLRSCLLCDEQVLDHTLPPPPKPHHIRLVSCVWKPSWTRPAVISTACASNATRAVREEEADPPPRPPTFFSRCLCAMARVWNLICTDATYPVPLYREPFFALLFSFFFTIEVYQLLPRQRCLAPRRTRKGHKPKELPPVFSVCS